MADIAKWALLLAGLVAIIALIVTLPVFEALNMQELTNAIAGISSIASGALSSARGIINCFLTPAGRTILTILLGYMFTKFLLKWAIQIVAIAYKWIFK